MEQTLKGRITAILEPKSGTGKNGKAWTSQEFVVEETATYPQKQVFSLFGEKVDNFQKYNKIGDVVEVSFNHKASEYNGKWYAKLEAWKVMKVEKSTPKPLPFPKEALQEEWEVPQPKNTQTDDLPF